MNRDEDPELWDLLGRSKSVEPSPFFARNVVRVVRSAAPEGQGFIAWLKLHTLVPTFSAAAAVVITAVTVQTLHHHHRTSSSDLASAEVQDADVAADLEVLVSNDDDNDDGSLL